MIRRLLVALALLMASAPGPVHGQITGLHATMDTLAKPREGVPKQWTFIGYSFTRGTSTNIAPSNDLLQGQVIGRLFGPNSTATVNTTANYVEQRFVPYFIYRPEILDGYAVFRGMFKIDYTWGDQAYGVGGNRGGGINAAQVNLQTLMANVDITPPDASWNVVLGLQRLYDNAYDPHDITLQQAQTSGYKLAFWGTNAVGANLFMTPRPGVQARVGAYQLWENFVGRNDDVALFMGDVDTHLAPKLEVGLDAWYLRDRARGAGGITVLGEGLNSALAAYNGAPRLSMSSNYHADIGWVGARVAWNRDFLEGRWWADAFVIANVGVIDTLQAGGFVHGADIRSAAANASLSYKYGMTAQDRISAEGLFTTGDGNGIADGTVSSVVTGNVYGSPVGIYSSHRALLLFPDPQVVNRYYSAVQDISNMGFGVTGAAVNVFRDWIPNRFYTKVGAATAFSNTKPAGGGSAIGTEINFEAKYNLRVFLTAGLDMGYLVLGDFFDAPKVTQTGLRPENPWVSFITLSWLMF